MESGTYEAWDIRAYAWDNLRNQKVLGIDICGECDTNMPLPEYMEDEEKNGELNKELYNFLLKRLKKYSL